MVGIAKLKYSNNLNVTVLEIKQWSTKYCLRKKYYFILSNHNELANQLCGKSEPGVRV